MALAFTALAGTGSNSPGAGSTATASLSPTDGRLYYAFFCAYRASTTIDQPTCAGWGQTWDLVKHQEHENILGAVSNAVTIFRCVAASSSAGALTFSYTNTPSRVAWYVIEVTGFDDSGGSNGSAATVQSAGTSTTSSPITVTLSAFGSSSNHHLAAGIDNDNANFTLSGDGTSLGSFNNSDTGSARTRSMCQNAANDTTATFTPSTGTGHFGGCAAGVEVKALLDPTGTISSSSDEVTSSITAAQGYPTTVASLIDEVVASLNAVMNPAGSITSIIDELYAAVTVAQVYTTTVVSTLDKVQGAFTVSQGYPVTISSMLDETSAALTIEQPYTLTITATLDEVVATLSATQIHTATIVATLDEDTANLTSLSQFESTIVSILDEDTVSLTVAQPFHTTINSSLDEAAVSVTATQEYASTIASILDEITANLTANLPNLFTISSTLAETEISIITNFERTGLVPFVGVLGTQPPASGVSSLSPGLVGNSSFITQAQLASTTIVKASNQVPPSPGRAFSSTPPPGV